MIDTYDCQLLNMFKVILQIQTEPDTVTSFIFTLIRDTERNTKQSDPLLSDTFHSNNMKTAKIFINLLVSVGLAHCSGLTQDLISGTLQS